MPFIDDSGKPVELSPEETDQYWSGQQPQSGQLTDETGKPVDPFKDLSTEDLVALGNKSPEQFDLLSAFDARPDLQKDPQMVAKVADAYHELRKPLLPSGLTAGKVAENVWGTLKGLGRNAANLTGGTALLLNSLGKEGQDAQDDAAAGQAALARSWAATQGAFFGIEKQIKTLAEKTGRATGLTKSLDDYDQQDKVNALFDALALHKTAGVIASGGGANSISNLITRGDENLQPQPEEVAQLTDPFSWWALGGAMHLAGATLPVAAAKVLPEAVTSLPGRAQAAAEAFLPKAVGSTAAVSADLAAKTLQAGQKVAPIAGAIGAPVAAAVAHDPRALVESLIFGSSGGEKLAQTMGKMATGMKSVADFSRQVAGSAPMRNAYAQAIRDTLEATPQAATELGKGVAFDVGQLAAAETPQERQSALGFGTAFGLAGAARGLGLHVLSGQIVAPRFFDVKNPVAATGSYPELEAIHGDQFPNLTPQQKAWTNGVRTLLGQAGADADLFVTGNTPTDQISKALQSAGVGAELADTTAQQGGGIIKLSNGRKLIVVQEPDSAPHEAKHAIEDLLGEDTNRQLDDYTKNTYGAQWNSFGQRYAEDINGGDPVKNWRETILDKTNWGRQAAINKLMSDTWQRYAQDARANGQQPPSMEDIKPLVQQHFQNLGEDWRNVLTPDEAQQISDRYVAREFRAENFDTWFKHAGPTLEPGKQMPERISRAVGQLMVNLGMNPLADRTTRYGVSPDLGLIDRMRQDIGQAAPNISVEPKNAPATTPAPRLPVGMPQPAQQTRDVAEAAPDARSEGALDTQRNISRQLASLKESGQGARLMYRSAPGEPAGSPTQSRETRRNVIEYSRTMPDDQKSLWQKLFFPAKAELQKSGETTWGGWVPEVFAANANRVAQWAADIGAVDLLPYELDTANRTFTKAGWQKLYADTQGFVQNQLAGRTGAGKPLVVPKEVQAAGGFQPEVGEASRFGPGQREADFISMLFGTGQLPKTARMSGRQMSIPLSIAGEEVSKATQPGRVQPPVVPRGTFEGTKAEKAGVAGREIQEVNPLRAELERAGQASGNDLPKMLEAYQNLNLRNILHAEPAPEQPRFGGNVLALTAGFAPKAGEEADESAQLRPKLNTPAIVNQFKDASPDVKNDDGTPKIFYHGSFNSEALVKSGGFDLQKTSPGGLFGSGFYFTDDPNAAGGPYLKNKLRMLLGMEPLGYALKPTAVNPMFEDRVPISKGTPGVFPAALNIKNPLQADKPYPIEQVRQALEPLRPELRWYLDRFFSDDAPATVQGKEIYDALKDADYGRIHGPGSLDVKTLHTQIADWLQKAGFDGISYMGGLRRKGVGLHNVIVALKPEQVISAVSGKPFASVEPGAIPAGEGDAQFAPSPNPRAVRSAAIRDEDTGKVYEGAIHASALMDYLAQKYPDRPEEMNVLDAFNTQPGITDGFVTNEGEFLTRQEAFQRAMELKQIDKEYPTFRHGGKNRTLESVTFDQQRKDLTDEQRRATPTDLISDFNKEFSKLHQSPENDQTLQAAAPKDRIRNPDAERLADEYAKSIGLEKPVLPNNQPVPMEYIKELADYLEDTPHAPDDPKVIEGYKQMLQEMEDQGNLILKQGIDVEPWPGKGEPYPNSRAMTEDVRDNKHLYFLPTDTEFGAAGGLAAAPEEIQNNLLTRPSGIVRHGKRLNVNEVLRFVHDYFGHTPEGNEFGPRGEFNALLTHYQLFSPEARRALMSELLMQSSWYFAGRHMRRADGSLPVKGDPDFVPFNKRQFADPKNLLPSEELFGKLEKLVNDMKLAKSGETPTGEQLQAAPKTFIVRHGATDMNNADPDKDLIRGHIDVPLNAQGRKDAEKAATDIANQGGVDHIISSDLQRTMQTSAAIAKKTGATVEADSRLRPWNFGPTIEGKPTSKMIPKIKYLTENPDVRPPGGETFNEFKDRFLEGFHAAQDENPDRNTAIVTHYRGSKLLEAWRATGTDNDTIDKAVFEKYDKDRKPGFSDIVDKQGAQFMPETRWHGKEREGEKEVEWGDVDQSFLNSDHRTPFVVDQQKKGNPPDVSLEELQKQGYKTVSFAGTPTFHDFSTRLVFYKSDRGEHPLTPEGIRAASEAASKEEKQVFKVAYPREDEGQFATPARRSKDDYKFPEATKGMFSKAWILPDGRPVQLGDKLHHDWLNENPEIKKKYGIKGTDEDNRVEALKKGFARVNYEKNTGTMKVEARAQDWPNVKESVRQMVQTNLPKIDNMDVHLLDKSAKRIVDQDGVALHTYDPEEKMGQLPFISAPGGATTMSAQAPAEEAQFSPMRGRTDDEEDVKKARQFWITNKGETIPAWAGHEEAAKETFLPDNWQPKDPEYDTDEIYDHALKAGHVRGVFKQHPDTLYLNGAPWSQLSTASQAEAKRLSNVLEVPLSYNGRPVEGGFEPLQETQFAPKMEKPDPDEFQRAATIKSALAKPNWAIVTASQEKRGKGTDEVNQIANENLEKALIADGYNPLRVEGKYKGEDQGLNFLVTGITPAQALALAKQYNQESVLTPHGLLYQDGTVNPVDASKHLIGPEAEKQDFYSKVENPTGKKAQPSPAFSMGIDFDKRLPLDEARKADEVRGPVSVARPALEAPRADFIRKPEDVRSLSLNHVLDNPDMQDFARTVIDKIKTIPGFKDIDATSVPKAMKEITKRMVANLQFLYDRSTPANREHWRQWYDFAHKMTVDWGKEFDLHPDIVAAVNAKISPQNDWYNNVTQTRAILETFRDDPKFTQDDRDLISSLLKQKDPKEQNAWRDELTKIKDGQRMSDMNDAQAGMFLRSHNMLKGPMATHDHNMEPTGGITGWTKSFDEWQSVMSILRNPSQENVDRQLGSNHKVRSFYNNHVAPESPDWTTIDTHAHAAAALYPYGSTDQQTKNVFGAVKNKASGYNGAYFLYQHAYEQLAKKLGLLPRELQSIIWEQMRAELSPEGKRKIQKAGFENLPEIYRDVREGKMTPAQGRSEVVKTFKEADARLKRKEKPLSEEIDPWQVEIEPK